MIKWYVDKTNKVPLYLQLKDLIKYHLSTGNLRDHDYLPGVNIMGKNLRINFETVRKAYKELEKEGLISMRRGCGSYVTLYDNHVPDIGTEKRRSTDSFAALKIGIRKLLLKGMSEKDIRTTLEKTTMEIARNLTRHIVIFTECNLHQVKEISNQLHSSLHLPVKPVLLKDLKASVERSLSEGEELMGVITTGFHVTEVRQKLRHIPVSVHALVTRMSPAARRRLESIDKKRPLGFICRDRDSIPLYRDLIRTDLGRDINLSCSTWEEKEQVEKIILSVQALLVSPPVYRDVKKITPREIPILNVFDSVDPMSLKLIKDRIHEQL